jgi:YegS/Rv2252/BmrU family lipid kinase
MYNPNSGIGNIRRYIDYIQKKLIKKFSLVEVHETTSHGDLVLTTLNSIDYDYLLFSGGDGTFNIVVSTLVNCENKPILGYIPSGTANDISKNLKLSRNIKKSLKIFLEGEPIEHDLGKINDKYFVYSAAIGKFTSVSYDTSRIVKKIFGKLAYYLRCVKSLFVDKDIKYSLKTSTITKEYNSPLLLIVNSISIGGNIFNKKGHRNDGTFDIFAINENFLKGLINLTNCIVFGHISLGRIKYSDYYIDNSLHVDVSENVCWTLDGEKGIYGPVDISILKNSFKIIVKKK